MKLQKIQSEVALVNPTESKEKDLVGEFLLNKYPNESTQKGIITDLKQFSLWLREKLDKSIFEVKSYELGVYRKHLIDLKYAVGSVNRKLSSLKAFYRYLHEVGFNEVNEALYLNLLKNRSKIGSTPAFNSKQLVKLFNSFDEDKLNDLRDKVIFGIAFFCAARVSAILNLKVEDVLKETSGLKLQLTEKGSKKRYLHCNSEILAPALLKYLNATNFKDGYLFRGYRVNKGFTSMRFGRANCHEMIKRRSKNLNLPKKFSMHSFRASFATAWLEKNYSIDSLQKIGGWENLDTVKRYDRNKQEASVSEMELMKLS